MPTPPLAQPATVTTFRIVTTQHALPSYKAWRTDRSAAAVRTANFFESLAAGCQRADMEIETDGGDSVAATGMVTFSGASGVVGAVINGVSLTVTAAGGDAATATAVAAQVNTSSNPLVQGLVTATTNGAILTITSARKGVTGNTQTLTATGTGATSNVTRLVGGLASTATGRYNLSI